MRRIGIALALVLGSLLSIAPAGCTDDERTDGDEPDDSDDGGEDADAATDAGTDWGSSGVFGHVLCVYSGFDVRWTACGFSAGLYSAETTSDPDNYYELELPPGLYNGFVEWGSTSSTGCEGTVSQVLVSDGLWVEIDIEADCTDYD